MTATPQSDNAQPTSRCTGRAIGLEGSDETSSTKPAEPATAVFSPTGDRSVDYDFGGNRAEDTDHFLTFSTPDANAVAAKDVYVALPTPLQEREGEGKGIFPTRAKQLAYTVKAGGGEIEVHFCLDPSLPRKAKPGSYQSALLIEAPGFKPQSVGINADLREDRDVLVWLLGFGSVVIGLVLKIVGDLAKDPNNKVSKATIKGSLNSWNVVLQFFGGIVFMAFTVWQIYYSSSHFGGVPKDWLTFALAIFISMITGISLASFAGIGKDTPVIQPNPPPNPPPAPDPNA